MDSPVATGFERWAGYSRDETVRAATPDEYPGRARMPGTPDEASATNRLGGATAAAANRDDTGSETWLSPLATRARPIPRARLGSSALPSVCL